MSVVTSRTRRRQKLLGSITSVSCDLSVKPPAETGGQCHYGVSCDLSETPPAETGGQCH